jgi:hypothetical protein
MEESNFPVLVTKAFRKVLKVGCLIPFNVLQSDELSFLRVRGLLTGILDDKYLRKDVLNS